MGREPLRVGLAAALARDLLAKALAGRGLDAQEVRPNLLGLLVAVGLLLFPLGELRLSCGPRSSCASWSFWGAFLNRSIALSKSARVR